MDAVHRLVSSVGTIKLLNEMYAPINLRVEYVFLDSGTDSFTSGAQAGITLSKMMFKDHDSHNMGMNHTMSSAFGVHGIVGGGSNIVTVALEQALMESDIVQVSYNSDASRLSHAGDYILHSRVSSSSSYQAHAIADIIKTEYGWERVVIVHSTDTDGIDSLAVFEGRAEALGIAIVGVVAIPPSIITDPSGEDRNEFASAILDLSETDARIFVFLIFNIEQAHVCLLTAARRDIIKANSIILGNSVVSSEGFWSDIRTDEYKMMLDTLEGYIGINEAHRDWAVTPTGKDFLTSIRSLNNTLSYTENGTEICSDETDSIGTRLFHRTSSVTGLDVCTGIRNQTDVGIDLTEFTGTIALISDAIRALVAAVIDYSKTTFTRDDGDFDVPDDISGFEISKFMYYTDFNLSAVTGNVRFSYGDPNANGYGSGDREFNVNYAVENFNNTNGTVQGFKLNRVGTWQSETGYTSCQNNTALQTAITGGCFTMIWGTVGNAVPSDRDPSIVLLMPEVFKAIIIAMFVVTLVVFLASSALLFYYRNTRLMRASQIPMMWIVLGSTLFAAIRIILATIDVGVDGEVCIYQFWFGHMSFMGVIALFAKTVRVHMIVNSKLKKVKVSVYQVLMFTAALFSVIILYMIITTSVNIERHVTTEVENNLTGQYSYEDRCRNNVLRDMGLYAWEALILLLSLKVCWDTRMVPDAVNEAPFIAKVIFGVVFICIITCAILWNQILQGWENSFLIAVAFFCSYLGLAIYYLGPKFLLLLSGADLNANFQIVKRDKDANKLRDQTKQKKKLEEALTEEDRESERKMSKSAANAFLTKMPTTIVDAESLMSLLRDQIFRIQMRAGGDVSCDSSAQKSSGAHDSEAYKSSGKRYNDSISGRGGPSNLSACNSQRDSEVGERELQYDADALVAAAHSHLFNQDDESEDIANKRVVRKPIRQSATGSRLSSASKLSQIAEKDGSAAVAVTTTASTVLDSPSTFIKEVTEGDLKDIKDEYPENST
eukprot:CAMPEP_0119051388 /NCGR_PEP_ID=MMETSP1177-20130426/73021_1 /TAXON_ID=2985 /ORGANISM="Ochromonas sp, Strain CCMP1899" /LENGTH=1001 /DNA_ID=CAMNT_0007030573 /DNA_START=227 /DNA_END=3232 /DNA_ORIENTATION=-